MSVFGPNPKVEEHWERSDFRGRVFLVWTVAWVSVMATAGIVLGFSFFWYVAAWVMHLFEPFSPVPGIWEAVRNGAATALVIFVWNFFVDRILGSE